MTFERNLNQLMTQRDVIPGHWTRLCVMSIDRGSMGAVWMACDRKTDVVAVYAEMTMKPLPQIPVIAEAIRRRGTWIPVLMDAFAFKRSETDGAQLAQRFVALNVPLSHGPYDEEAGIKEVDQRLDTQRLIVDKTCKKWLLERTEYRRNPVTGKLPEEGFHLMRATGLGLMLDPHEWVSENKAASDAAGRDITENRHGASSTTGY